jgi:hypothetical protein
MPNPVEARFAYGGLFLTCDEPAYARLRELLCGEPSVAAAVGTTRDGGGMRFISIRQVAAEITRTPALRWWELLVAVIAGCLSSAVFVVGVITLVRWLWGSRP